MITGVHSTFYWTSDMDAAVAFYKDVLGLDMSARYGEDWSEFKLAGTTVALHGTRGAAPPHAGATVVFEVDDLDRTMGTLRERGVEFAGQVIEVPETGRFATFHDPAGNVVQLFQPGAARA